MPRRQLSVTDAKFAADRALLALLGAGGYNAPGKAEALRSIERAARNLAEHIEQRSIQTDIVGPHIDL